MILLVMILIIFMKLEDSFEAFPFLAKTFPFLATLLKHYLNTMHLTWARTNNSSRLFKIDIFSYKDQNQPNEPYKILHSYKFPPPPKKKKNPEAFSIRTNKITSLLKLKRTKKTHGN